MDDLKKDIKNFIKQNVNNYPFNELTMTRNKMYIRWVVLDDGETYKEDYEYKVEPMELKWSCYNKLFP